MEHLLEQKVNWDQSPKIPFFILGSDLRFWLLTSRDQELPESLPWLDLTFPAANPECQEPVWRIPILVFQKEPEGAGMPIPGRCSWNYSSGRWEGESSVDLGRVGAAWEMRPRLGCAGDFFVGIPRGVNYRRGKWNFRMAAQNPFPVSRSFCSLSIPLGIPIPCPSLGHFQRCLQSQSLFGHADSNFPSPAAFPVIPLHIPPGGAHKEPHIPVQTQGIANFPSY